MAYSHWGAALRDFRAQPSRQPSENHHNRMGRDHKGTLGYFLACKLR
jgi:hypothetical protein